MATNDLLHTLPDAPLRDAGAPAGCAVTTPGHATDLARISLALSLRDDPFRAPVDARVDGVTGDHVILALPGGPLVARCHDAAHLRRLLAAGACPDGPFGRFSPLEHLLLLGVDPQGSVDLGRTSDVPLQAFPTGAVAAFNLALPWHAFVPCGRPAQR
jgi:hypothetical protein